MVIAPHVDDPVYNGGGAPHVEPGPEAPCQLAIRQVAPCHGAIIARVLSVVVELHRVVLRRGRNGYNARE